MPSHKNKKRKVVAPATGLVSTSAVGYGGTKVQQQIARNRKASGKVVKSNRARLKKQIDQQKLAQAQALGSGRTLRDRSKLKPPDRGDDIIMDEEEIDARTQLTITLPDGTEEVVTLDQLEPDPADDDDGGAYTERVAKEPYPYARPGWAPNFYNGIARDNRTRNAAKIGLALKQAALPPTAESKSTLWCESPTCAMATRLIFIQSFTGHEIGPSVDAYKNKGRPPIDHHGPDWVVRCDVVKQWGVNGNLDDATIRAEVIKQFHSPFLRILHKKCNLKRGKS